MPEHRTCCTGAAHAYIAARPGDRGSINHRLTRLFRTGPDTERTPARCSAQSSPHITYGFKPAHSAIHYSLHHTTSRTWNTNTRSYPIPNRTRRSKHHSPSIPRMPAAARDGASQMYLKCAQLCAPQDQEGSPRRPSLPTAPHSIPPERAAQVAAAAAAGWQTKGRASACQQLRAPAPCSALDAVAHSAVEPRLE